MRVIAAKIGRRLSVMAMLVPLSAGAGLRIRRIWRGGTSVHRSHGLDRLDWPYRSRKDSPQQLNQTRLVSTDRSKCQKQSLELPGRRLSQTAIGRHTAHCSERIELRMAALGFGWADVTATQVYTIFDIIRSSPTRSSAAQPPRAV